MLGGSREDAEDLAQETFLKAFRALNSFREESQFRTWVRRIATNVALNHLKKKRLLTMSLEVGEGESERTLDMPDDQFSPEVHLTGALAQQFVEGALNQLSPNLRMVFVLKELEGYTHEETARLLGVNAQAVRVRHHRAKKQLAQYLQNSELCRVEKRETAKR